MGRDWYFNWGNKSSSKKKGVAGGGGGERKVAAPPAAMAAAAAATTGGCMNAVLHMFDFHQFQLCLYPHDKILTSNVSKHHDPTSPKGNTGVEAPRNSLESLDDMVHNGPPSLASIMKDENIDTSHILASRRDTKLKLVQAPRNKVEEILSSSSESNSSPAGVRTPTLVARLMGLDILPESTNTTPRSSTCQQQPIRSPHVSSTPPTRKTKGRISNSSTAGSQSLPETPRSLSSSVRRKSTTNIIDQHRLSLQINKENSIVKEMESSRPSCSAISSKKRDGKIYGSSNYNYEEECRSPGYYARQIMRQVKETVSRRVGVDITNTVDLRDKDIRRDEHLLSSNKPKKSSSNKIKMMMSVYDESEQVIPKNNVDVKLQLKDEKNKNKNNLEEKKEDGLLNKVEEGLNKKLLVSSESNNKKSAKLVVSSESNNNKSAKKVTLKSLDSIKNKKDDQFVRGSMRVSNYGISSSKKCKRMTLSSDLFQGSLSSFVPFKKDSSPCPSPTTKLLDNKEVLSKAQPLKDQTSIKVSTNTSTSTSPLARSSRIPSQGYMQEEGMHTSAGQGDHRRSNRDTSSILEFQYISRILKCTGIDRDTPVSFTRWFSPSHPLDPSIFHTLETTHYPNLNDPSSPHYQKSFTSFNRKLIFHLVDEILADLLKPYMENKPWALTSHGQNSHYTHQQQLQINGYQLVKSLCTRIRSFTSANCQTLQDIDALVVKNMTKIGLQSDWIAMEEEGEAIVVEIERDIVNSLVQEIATLSLGNHVRSMQKYISTIRL